MGVLLVGCAMGLPPAAFGATTIGQTAAQPATCDPGPLTMTQKTIGLGFGYWATSAGVITAWSIQANVTSGEMVKLKLLHATGNLDQYKTVAEDTLRPLTPNVLNTFPNASSTAPVRIPAQTNDKIAVSAHSTASPCDSFMNAPGDRYEYVASDPPVGASATYIEGGAGSRVNISARLEPDNDHDGFGDETQDKCATDAGTQGACTSTAVPSPADTRAPKATLSGSSKQNIVKQKAVIVRAQTDESSTLKATGKINVPGASKLLKLVPASASAATNAKVTLKLKISRKTLKAVKRALRKGRKVRATVAVVARDPAGNASAVLRRTVKAKRVRRTT
jgi:hypothetical protein